MSGPIHAREGTPLAALTLLMRLAPYVQGGSKSELYTGKEGGKKEVYEYFFTRCDIISRLW